MPSDTIVITQPTDFIALGLIEAMREAGWDVGYVRLRAAMIMVACNGGVRRIVRMVGEVDDRQCATTLARACGLNPF